MSLSKRIFRSVREYLDHLCTHKFYSTWDEIQKFIEKDKITQLTQYEIDFL